ncbi:AfsR/SARP family transcriptional regulator [Micromonospora sp. NPDC049230]|uniref:AfsR/SARP family transcriptional regulator n=1 Tax=Micromonospora sp. NPDC049230 TaxID=3155502 RepID=UPI0033F0F8A5
MSGTLNFGVLGPVAAWRDGDELDLGSPQQRATLATLLLREGAQASVGEIATAVWGETPPRAAAGIVRTYVSQLRQALGGGSASAIESVAGGYALPVGPETLDLALFRQLVARAEQARRAADPALAAVHLRDALALFRGTPLAGVRGHYAEAQRGRLNFLRAAAVEDRLAVELELGRHAGVVAELWALVAEYPLRERLRELQMLALHRAGRPAEAFAVYQDARRVLAAELAVEPGPALQELHARLLQSDPTLLGPTSSAGPAGNGPLPLGVGPRRPAADRPVPAQLPADLANFVGRSETVRELTGLLTRADEVSVVGIVGLGGVGKTALAVHLAHAVRDRFPDGQVYADLGGMTEQPADLGMVLAGFLRAFGITDQALPADLGERAALWRTLLAERRVLIVLDDARDGAQLQHLLPAAAGSAVIMTSWRRLLDLPGVHWRKLSVLRRDESLAMLEKYAGTERVRAEPDVVQRLAVAFDDHPMGLWLAGTRLAARPDWSMAAIEGRMIDEFSDPVISQEDCLQLVARFERIYRRLAAPHAAVYRLLAAPDWSEFSLATAAVALGLPERETDRLLLPLADAHLLEALPADRYRFLGLIKLFGWRRGLVEDDPALAKAAIRRLARYYLAVARNALRAIEPSPDAVPQSPFFPALAEGPSFADAASAGAWLRVEHAQVQAVAAQAARYPDLDSELAGFWPVRRRLETMKAGLGGRDQLLMGLAS